MLIEKFKSDIADLLRIETSNWKQKKLQELSNLLENYGRIRITFREETDSRKKAKFALALKQILLRIHGLYKGLFAEEQKAKLRTDLIEVAKQNDVTVDNGDLALLVKVVNNPPI